MRLKSIQIENFMSFSKSHFQFPDNGIIKLSGKNYDVLQNGIPTSNGSGKTSLLLAVSQGLFNKVPNNVNIDMINNTITKRPFKLIIEFTHNGGDYRIVNDRATLSMKLFNLTTGELISKKITETISIIEGFFGMNFSQFSKLAFITPTTLNGLFVSDKSLIAEHFHLDKIDTIVSILKEKRRELNKDFHTENQRLQDAIAKQISEFNLEDIENEINGITKKIKQLERHEYKLKGDRIARELNEKIERKDYLTGLLKQLSQNDKLLGLEVCPTCGTKIEQVDLTKYSDQKVLAKNELDAIDIQIKELQETYGSLYDDYYKLNNMLQTQLRVADSKKLTISKFAKSSMEDINKLEKQVGSLKFELGIIKDTLNYVEGGNIVLAHLQDFVVQLSILLLKTGKEVGFPFVIVPKIVQTKLQYKILRGDDEINLELLSGGEKTIAALLVLYSFLKLLKDIFNISLPILTFDEVFSRVDSTNLKQLNELVEKFHSLSVIFIIQHHNELPDKLFNMEVLIEKHGGLSSIN